MGERENRKQDGSGAVLSAGGIKLSIAASTTILFSNTWVLRGAPGKAYLMRDLKELERIAIGSPWSVLAGEDAMDAIRKSGLDKQLDRKQVMTHMSTSSPSFG